MYYILLTLALLPASFHPAFAEESLPESCLHNPYVLTCFWPHETSLRDFHHKQLNDIAIEVETSFKTASPLNEVLLKGHSSTWKENTPVKENAVGRALAARKVLKKRLSVYGVPLDRINIIATGVGDEEPLYTNDTAEGRAYNRRVEVTLTHTPFIPEDDEVGPDGGSDGEPEKEETDALVFSTNTIKEAKTELNIPTDMPPVRFPEIKGCSESNKERLNKVWALAHYYTWRADQVMDWLQSHPEQRADAWSKDAPGKKGDLQNSSPRNWFGPYGKGRFKNVDKAIEKVFKKRFLGHTFKVVCKEATDKTPDASHNVFGRVVIYDSFFTPNRDMLRLLSKSKISYQALTVIHELYHPLSLRNGTWSMDTHCDGYTCDKFYNEEVLDLSWSNKKRDYRLAIRNNDNHAFFISTLGDAIRKGKLLQFPPK